MPALSNILDVAEALADLEAARATLEIRVLEKDVRGRTCRLVLAGEQHYDTTERLAVTLPILRWFPDRAVENTRQSYEKQGSSSEDREGGRVLFRIPLVDPEHEGGLSDHAFASREHPPRKIVYLEREDEVRGVRVLAVLDLLATKVSVWLFNLGLVLGGGGLLAWLLGLRPGPRCALVGAILVVGHLVRHALHDLDESGRLRVSRHLPERRWIALLGTWTHQAVVRRDLTMARRLDEAFIEDPEIEELLAIVGKVHLPGMRRCLATEHGWTERSWGRAMPG